MIIIMLIQLIRAWIRNQDRKLVYMQFDHGGFRRNHNPIFHEHGKPHYENGQGEHRTRHLWASRCYRDHEYEYDRCDVHRGDHVPLFKVPPEIVHNNYGDIY